MIVIVFGFSKDFSNRERVVASVVRYIEVCFWVDVDVLNFCEYLIYDINGFFEILFCNLLYFGVM